MTSDEEIQEFYAGFKEALHARNYERAAGFLHMMNMSIYFHTNIAGQITFAPLVQREFVRFLDTYKREFPDDPSGYMLRINYHRNTNPRLDLIRKTWADTCAHAVKGFHYQPGVTASVFDAETGAVYTSLGGMGLGDRVRDRLQALARGEDDGDAERQEASPPTVADAQPAVETCSGEPVGLDAVSLNGTLSGFTVPTRYYFRYGTSADDLSHTSPARDVPAGTFGRVRDVGANVFHRIRAYTSALEFIDADSPGEASSVAMKNLWPFGKDRNHLDGIGIIDLFMGWENQPQYRGRVDGIEPRTPIYPSATYCGESVDLRDAQFRVAYRTGDLNPKDFRPVAWLHGRTGTAAFPDDWDDLAAWAVTGDGGTGEIAADGEWHTAVFNMPAHSVDWSFCGSNMEEMGPSMARYTYAPIQDVQRENTGGNLCITFVDGHELDTPEGDIDIAALELRYRSRSLLGPGQGAELVGKPQTGGVPEYLTDGHISDLSRCYVADLADGDAVELTWRLRGDAQIETFRLYQCAFAPAGEIEISVSEDGAHYLDVWSGVFEEVPEDPAQWGTFAEETGFVRAAVLASPQNARFIRLRLLSAQRGARAGLDAFEVFGSGLPFIPAGDRFTLSEKIDGLPPGETVFAQLVAENDDGTFEGDVVEIARPKTDVPMILSASMTPLSGEEAILRARTIAMGQPARLYIDIEADDGSRIPVPDRPIGQWQAPRDVRVRIAGLKPGTSYTVTCRADNSNGASQPWAFKYTPSAP